MARAYEEIIDFIAEGYTPEELIAFRPSSSLKMRVTELVDLKKTGGLSADRTSELEHYLQLEHLMRLAKAQAHKNTSENISPK